MEDNNTLNPEEIMNQSNDTDTTSSSSSSQSDASDNGNAANSTEVTDPKQAENDNLKLQVEELKDKYLRLYADFDNFKKRTAKERLELIDTAGKEVIKDLLPVIDDFERATKSLETSQDFQVAKDGFHLIFNKINHIMQSKGLKAMDAIGKTFDVELHEAITEIPAPNAEMAGKVVDEIEKGYYLNNKLIRFAKVVVGKQM